MNEDWTPDPTIIIDLQIVVDQKRPARCANCKGRVAVLEETCPHCQVEFTQVTNPYETDREKVQSWRPNLTYVVKEWV